MQQKEITGYEIAQNFKTLVMVLKVLKIVGAIFKNWQDYQNIFIVKAKIGGHWV